MNLDHLMNGILQAAVLMPPNICSAGDDLNSEAENALHLSEAVSCVKQYTDVGA
jgi:hypothetical protein